MNLRNWQIDKFATYFYFMNQLSSLPLQVTSYCSYSSTSHAGLKPVLTLPHLGSQSTTAYFVKKTFFQNQANIGSVPWDAAFRAEQLKVTVSGWLQKDGLH
jgi:hypothetical protein